MDPTTLYTVLNAPPEDLLAVAVRVSHHATLLEVLLKRALQCGGHPLPQRLREDIEAALAGRLDTERAAQ